MYSFGVFLKPIAAEFGWMRATTSGAYSMGVFALGIFFIVTGRLSDRFGPRIVTTACAFLLVLGLLLMSRLSTLWQLYLFWGVAIMGMSGGFVPMMSTVARWFVKRRGFMTGIVVSGVGVGIAIMPPVASWLISSYGWRTALAVIGVIGFVVIILAAQFLKRDPGKIGQLPYGDNEAEPARSVPGAGGLSFKETIRTGQFWKVWVMYLFFGACLHTTMLHIVPHATDLGIYAVSAANILAVIGGLNVAGRIGMGSLSDRVTIRSSLIIGFALLSVALLWLQLATELWGLYLFAVIVGFGIGGLVALESPLTAELFGLRAHGAILGVIVFGATTGGAIGSLLAGYLFDISGSYYLAFLIYAVLAIAGIILASLLRPGRQKV